MLPFLLTAEDATRAVLPSCVCERVQKIIDAAAYVPPPPSEEKKAKINRL